MWGCACARRPEPWLTARGITINTAGIQAIVLQESTGKWRAFIQEKKGKGENNKSSKALFNAVSQKKSFKKNTDLIKHLILPKHPAWPEGLFPTAGVSAQSQARHPRQLLLRPAEMQQQDILVPPGQAWDLCFPCLPAQPNSCIPHTCQIPPHTGDEKLPEISQRVWLYFSHTDRLLGSDKGHSDGEKSYFTG